MGFQFLPFIHLKKKKDKSWWKEHAAVFPMDPRKKMKLKLEDGGRRHSNSLHWVLIFQSVDMENQNSIASWRAVHSSSPPS